VFDANIEKLKLVLQNLERAAEHLRAFIETAEMPEAILTLISEQGPQKQEFLASVLGVGVRELNEVLQYLKKNERIATKGKIGTSNCVVSLKGLAKKGMKDKREKNISDKEDIFGDLKKLEAILSTSKEQY